MVLNHEILGPLLSPVSCTPTQHNTIVWLWDEQNRTCEYVKPCKETNQWVSEWVMSLTTVVHLIVLEFVWVAVHRCHRIHTIHFPHVNTSPCLRPDGGLEHLDVIFGNDPTSAGEFPDKPFFVHLLQGGHHVPSLCADTNTASYIIHKQVSV